MQNQIALDQDFVLEDCVIRVQGLGRFEGRHSFNNETLTLKNVKVYSCLGAVGNFLKTDFGNDGGRPRLIIRNSIFENFLELFHIRGAQYDIRNSTFQNPHPWDNHIIHIPFHDASDVSDSAPLMYIPEPSKRFHYD